MFSTFTGNSRRPRNVNLSGQTGNPFANTSWSPSQASSATKTVSEAQAGREKRQAERQRLKAAGKIQRVWRGHSARQIIYEQRRATYDEIYSQQQADVEQRLALAFRLLISFFRASRHDDVQRVLLLVRDANSLQNGYIAPPGIQSRRIGRFMGILLDTLNVIAENRTASIDITQLLGVIGRIAQSFSNLLYASIDPYYATLAKVARIPAQDLDWSQSILEAVAFPLHNLSGQTLPPVYQSFAFSFMTGHDILLFENNSELFAQKISGDDLSRAILDGYGSPKSHCASSSQLLQLLAHFIALGRASTVSRQTPLYLDALSTQVTRLSSEISLGIDVNRLTEPSDLGAKQGGQSTVNSYVANQVSSLVNHDGISALLQDFSRQLDSSSKQQTESASLLAGYILTLLQTFRSTADDTRMRLFMEQIPTPSGSTPLLKLLWQAMRQNIVFRKLKTESQRPVNVIGGYLRRTSRPSQSSAEEQEWRVILLFLEIYNFVLLLSDDEDFFSGINPQIIHESAPPSRLRSCSLSLPDVEALTIFLKNAAFALYYNAESILSYAQLDGPPSATASESQLPRRHHGDTHRAPQPTSISESPSKVGFDGLRSIITTTLKMLYDRDSRKQFLPDNHWLMTDKLDQDGFVTAVIAEEERQALETEAGSSDDDSGIDSDTGPTVLRRTGFNQQVLRHMNQERARTQQMRAHKERRLAELGPKLEILKHMPFVVPFETRVTIFRQFISLDLTRRRVSSPSLGNPFMARHPARVRRHSLFEDAFEQFYQLGDGIKDPIHITFVDQFGEPEAGIDGGGVTKEFLINVTSEAFKGSNGPSNYFTSNDKGLLYPDPTAMDKTYESLRRLGVEESGPEWREYIISMLKRYEFLGRIIGKCLYEGILVDLVFAGFFLLKWTSAGDGNGYKGSINDLRDMDEELYKGLLTLKNYPGDVAKLGFDFTIEDQISQPNEPLKTVNRKLIPNGDQTTVNNDNRPLYISYAARHRLVYQPIAQTKAFLQGLRAVIKPSWLSMFNQTELQRLIGGEEAEIDVEDLRRNTVYSGLYEIGDDGLEHPTIAVFWRVVHAFDDAQRRDLLRYVSSTPRAPLLGFAQLVPKFSIRDAGSDEERLPSTSTCVNLLKLPRYTNEATLRKKLLYAIQSGAGFDLS